MAGMIKKAISQIKNVEVILLTRQHT